MLRKVGSSTISPYFTIPRLQLRIASTTHYTISWTSCQRTWTSHHTNLTLAEPHIKLLYANLTLPRPRKVQTWHIHKLHATSASHNLPLMLRQPLTSHCTNLTFHQPRIQYVNSTGPEPHITLTAHCLSSTRRELHILSVPTNRHESTNTNRNEPRGHGTGKWKRTAGTEPQICRNRTENHSYILIWFEK